MTHLPNPYTPSIQQAVYKQSSADFIVNEQLMVEFSEVGEHLWLHIQKTNLNTQYVAKLLAKWAGIAIKDVGFSGLKDRYAVTKQWFSLRIPSKQYPSEKFDCFCQTTLASEESLQVLAEHWHHKKLSRGTHTANHFIITLREVIGEHVAIASQLKEIAKQGVPNYFGEQRFGHEQQNITQAIELFTHHTIHGKKVNRKFDQDKISLYLSAARSEIFNAIVAKRIELQHWQTPLSGEVMNLAGSNSLFVPETIDAQLLERLQAGDIHLTGALWGVGELKSFAEVAALERAVVEDNSTYQCLAKGLVAFGLKQQRRSLRLIPEQLTWQWLNDNSLMLDFRLPTGSFATTVLATLMVSAQSSD